MISSSDGPNRSSVYSSALSATRSVNVARASSADSTAARVSSSTARASSRRPAVTRLWKRQARWRARRVSGRSGRFRARRPAPILISGEIANMPAMLRRTSASCRAGSVSRSARSANAIACSLLPAMCSAIAVVPTISPRCGWWAGAISSARCPNCAAVPGSVVTSAFAASSSVVDRHLVTDLGAGGELHGDFDRQGAGFEQDNGGLAVERAAGGDRARWRGRPRG